MDALAMNFPDNSFDLVWACESGEHMPDKKKYIDEMTRVLKPGGTLVIACWCQREEGDRFASASRLLLQRTSLPTDRMRCPVRFLVFMGHCDWDATRLCCHSSRTLRGRCLQAVFGKGEEGLAVPV